MPKCDRFGHTASGYFDAPEKLVEAAATWEGKANVYMTINATDPALLARANNRIVAPAQSTTADGEVGRRSWLFLDIDSVRPSGISASEAELAEARKLLEAATAYLATLGWPSPITCLSGNGYYALFPIDLPNTTDSLTTVQNVLGALATRFNTPTATIDTTVANASRIACVIGTTKKKGDPTPERPHRRSRMLSLPAELVPVPLELLEEVASQSPGRSRVTQATSAVMANPVVELLDAAGIDYREQPPDANGSVWYHVRTCPFHGPDRPYECGVGQAPDGRYLGKCFHPEGAGKGWQEWKAALGLDAAKPRAAGGTQARSAEAPLHRHSGNAERLIDIRGDELTRRLGREVRKGLCGAALERRARELNDFEPPLPASEIEKILRSARQWPCGEEGPALVCEAAHAAVLESAWIGLYRWAHHEGSWRRWNGCVWEKQSEAVVVAAAQKVLRRHYADCLAKPQGKAEDERLHALHRAACRYASVLGGLAFLKGEDGFHTEAAQWDADPYLLNCADGILDLRTQTLGPHGPAALCTKVTTWPFADSATTGAWQRHLELCLPNPAVRRQVQRDLGRALVAADLEESLPIWHGSGANGKSTTERAMQRGLGDYARQAARNLLVASKQERHPTEIADLAGARLVFADEIERGKRLDEALVKDLTGGGRKKARFMRCDNFEFEQTFSIFFSVNHRPEIAGSDRGIWRRIRLVPWTVEIPEQRPQEEVVAELDADGGWMLRWMVAGFADWQADHHWVAEEVRAATEAYHADQDRLGGFLGEVGERKPFAQVSVGELYEAYASWCTSSGEECLGKIAFGKQLKDRGFAQTKDADGTRLWKGLRLRTASDGRNAASSHATSQLQEEPEELPVPAVDPGNRNERTPS